jgi:hypothetical protein
MKLVIQGGLLVVAIVLGWLIYESVDSKLEFQKMAESRKAVVVERLKDIRTAQLSYKAEKGEYAASFDKLINYIKTDSITYIRATGNVPDTLTELQAVEMGIVIRDTFKIAVIDTLFAVGYPVDSLQYVPFSNNETFVLEAGEVEKNKVNVKVFEAFADYKKIFTGMELSNENIKLDDGLRVGSMTDATTNGNWE